MNKLTRTLNTLALAAVSLAAFIGHSNAATIVYNDFSSVAGLTLNGSAQQAGSVLRLTDNYWQGGSAFSSSAVSLSGNVSFSSFFSFRITTEANTFGDGDGPGADGLTFVVQTVANNVGGIGGGIGYAGLLNSVAVEFDTYDNGYGDQYNGNHVGIDINGSLTANPQINYPNRLNDGTVWYSWVDYNGVTDDLEVRLSASNVRPASALLIKNVDLTTVLGTTSAFVGFTSGTGAGYGLHDILSWEFRDTYNPVGVPDGGSTWFLLSSGLLGIASIRRRLALRC